MICKAVLSVRIVPPNDPTLPYVSVCKPLNGAQDKLCAIAGIDLPQPTVPVPEQVLEIEMAVFPADQVPIDPLTGELLCPKVEFGATGLPMTSLPNCTDEDPGTCPKVPAVGGRAFYHPGDETTVVTLGCTDLDDQLRSASCSGANSIPTTATVTDFDSGVSVDQNIANRLTVSIGKPTPIGPDYECPRKTPASRCARPSSSRPRGRATSTSCSDRRNVSSSSRTGADHQSLSASPRSRVTIRAMTIPAST